MLVSAVLANSGQTVFNTRIENSGRDKAIKTTSIAFKDKPEDTTRDLTKILDAINEWKYFCHKQIEQGKLDIIS